MAKPWVTSTLLALIMTLSPVLTSITGGTNSNILAVTLNSTVLPFQEDSSTALGLQPASKTTTKTAAIAFSILTSVLSPQAAQGFPGYNSFAQAASWPAASRP